MLRRSSTLTMKRCSTLLAVNVSRGLDADTKANMLPTYEGRERLYGTHCIESVLRVMAKHPSSPMSMVAEQGGGYFHPLRRGGGKPHLYIWNRSEGGRRDQKAAHDEAGPSSCNESSAARLEALGRRIRIPVTAVPRSTLVQLCGDRRHQNAVLEVGVYEPRKIAQFPPVLTASASSSTQLVLFLDHIIDPMNLGNILRTSYFFGVRHIILSSDCCRCTPTVARASVGVLETLSVSQLAHGITTSAFLADARRRAEESGVGLELLAATAAPTSATSDDGRAAALRPSTRVLILGNEDAGLSPQVVEQCTHSVHIPVLGDQDVAVRGLSLNVNSACAVLLAHLSHGNPLLNRLKR
jgi:tRNA G18 (ribose-2'-O)-methylase SpoU